jgi:hypothetical protein
VVALEQPKDELERIAKAKLAEGKTPAAGKAGAKTSSPKT